MYDEVDLANFIHFFDNFSILTAYQNELEQLYMNYYSRYLYLITFLLELKAQWTTINFILTGNLVNTPPEVNEPFYILLKDIFSNLQQTSGYLD